VAKNADSWSTDSGRRQ